MSKPDFRIYQVGSFVYNQDSDTLDLTIPISPSDHQVLQNIPHPGQYLLEEPEVFSGAIGQYGSAQSIEELNEAVSVDYKDLFWGLFELAATFRSATRFSINVSRKDAPSVLIDTTKGRKYAWWQTGDSKIYVAAETASNAPVVAAAENNSTNFNPGELLFAFSIVAEHIRLGSYRFVIGNVLDSERIYISFHDHEIPDFRMNLEFPLMKEREVNTH